MITDEERKKLDTFVEELISKEWVEEYDDDFQKKYDRPADYIDIVEQPYYIYRWVIKHIKGNNLRILDVGSGWGILTRLLTEKGHNVTGIDVSKKAVEFAKEQYPKGDFRQLYAEKVESLGEKFDVIICMEMLEHIVRPEAIIKEFNKVIKPGGLIFITVPKKDMIKDNKHLHIFNFTKLAELMNLEFEQDKFYIYEINKFFDLDLKKINDINRQIELIKRFPHNIYAVKVIKNG